MHVQPGQIKRTMLKISLLVALTLVSIFIVPVTSTTYHYQLTNKTPYDPSISCYPYTVTRWESIGYNTLRVGFHYYTSSCS